jgi:hypothetical protein
MLFRELLVHLILLTSVRISPAARDYSPTGCLGIGIPLALSQSVDQAGLGVRDGAGEIADNVVGPYGQKIQTTVPIQEREGGTDL